METVIELGSVQYLNDLVDSALLMILDSEEKNLDRETAMRGVKAALENPVVVFMWWQKSTVSSLVRFS